MTHPYFVTPGDAPCTWRISGPGLAYSEETHGAIVVEDTDKAKVDLICSVLCCAHRAGVRDAQDAMKTALGIRVYRA